MNQQSQLKLIALLLPDAISQHVKNEQQFIAKTWGPKHALRTPPHITIIPPLSVTDDEEKSLLKIGEKIRQSTHVFTLHLDQYDTFKPRVVFIHLSDSSELNVLHDLWRKDLMKIMPHLMDRYPERPYHPHITLANRDVTPDQFKKIWAHYAEKTYTASFQINTFWILNHEHHGWVKEKEFQFISSQIQDI